MAYRIILDYANRSVQFILMYLLSDIFFLNIFLHYSFFALKMFYLDYRDRCCTTKGRNRKACKE